MEWGVLQERYGYSGPWHSLHDKPRRYCRRCIESMKKLDDHDMKDNREIRFVPCEPE